MTEQEKSCLDCKNLFDGFPLRCRAYPHGIPLPILSGEYDHSKPLNGDNGIQFEPIDEADEE